MPRRRVCYVTGTRAEFGLMRRTLRAIQSHPKLQLQLIVTGMHLHARHGRSIDVICNEGWKIDAVVPWALTDSSRYAQQTGRAMSAIASVLGKLKTDVVLVCGDRVEPFAAASAGHLSHRVVAHVHGGDRAQGQTDDSLRHAITKLSHVHFAATRQSAERIRRLGDDSWRIHKVGSPGIDNITRDAVGKRELHDRFPRLASNRYALLVLHPIDIETRENERADRLLSAIQHAGIEQVITIYPNNDPGAAGIIRCWNARKREMTYLLKDVPRDEFLGVMRDAAVLVGNSSSGIIEAASFGTPVIDVGPRQRGREHSANVTHVSYSTPDIVRALKKIWNNGRPRRFRGRNVYGGGKAGMKIADVLAKLSIDERLLTKLITY